ncbi:MAG TPA: hypothetical protein ENI05_04760 [Porticoccus sp.]|nr:hypothetical protein [Porticoccus sp.]
MAEFGSSSYEIDHRIAKVVVCAIYILLGTASIETGNAYIALMPGTVVWFFGVNTIVYMLDSILGHQHCHRKV